MPHPQAAPPPADGAAEGAPPAAPPVAPPPDLGPPAPTMPTGGFDPGAAPPPPDPAAEAERFAAYAAPHLDALAAGPEGDRPSSEFEPPSGLISGATQEPRSAPEGR